MASNQMADTADDVTTGARLEESKRVGRVLRLVQLIHLRPRRYLRRDLAERFEVSERQIDKDLELVRHALVLELRHSPQGYYFEDMPHLPTLSLSFGEALALLLAAQTASQVPGVDDSDLDSAIARVEAAFPQPLRQLLRQRHTVTADWRRNRHRSEVLEVLHEAMSAFRQQQAEQARAGLAAGGKWRDAGLVFTNATGGGLDGEALSKRFRRELAAPGLPDMTWHTLRHCYASLQAAEGATLQEIMHDLGHTDVRTTLRYAHLFPDGRQESAARIDRALSRRGT